MKKTFSILTAFLLVMVTFSYSVAATQTNADNSITQNNTDCSGCDSTQTVSDGSYSTSNTSNNNTGENQTVEYNIDGSNSAITGTLPIPTKPEINPIEIEIAEDPLQYNIVTKEQIEKELESMPNKEKYGIVWARVLTGSPAKMLPYSIVALVRLEIDEDGKRYWETIGIHRTNREGETWFLVRIDESPEKLVAVAWHKGYKRNSHGPFLVFPGETYRANVRLLPVTQQPQFDCTTEANCKIIEKLVQKIEAMEKRIRYLEKMVLGNQQIPTDITIEGPTIDSIDEGQITTSIGTIEATSTIAVEVKEGQPYTLNRNTNAKKIVELPSIRRVFEEKLVRKNIETRELKNVRVIPQESSTGVTSYTVRAQVPNQTPIVNWVFPVTELEETISEADVEQEITSNTSNNLTEELLQEYPEIASENATSTAGSGFGANN